MSPYLTPGEVRAKLGLSRRTLSRRIAQGEVPGVRVAPNVLRIEARYCDASLDEPDPPALLQLAELGKWLRVRVRTVRKLVRGGGLAEETWSSAGVEVPTGWISRRAILRFLNDNSLEPVPLVAPRRPTPAPTPPPVPAPKKRAAQAAPTDLPPLLRWLQQQAR